MANEAVNMITREQTLEFLRTHDHYLLLCHAHPDGDTLGSAAALKQLLKQMKKTARIVCASPVPDRLRFLTDAPEEMSIRDGEDLSAYTVVSVDIATTALMGEYETYFAQNTVALAIDHHGTHAPFAANVLLDAGACACAEIIFDLAALAFGYDVEHPMPRELARPLYTAISTDSGSMMYSSVTPATHLRTAVLLASGIDHSAICAHLYENKTYAEIRATRAAYDLFTLSFNGKVGIVIFTEETMKQYELTDQDVEIVVNLIRAIDGVQVAVHVKYRRPGEYKVSMRSVPGIDVSAVCKTFGGGGHVSAAGCTFFDTEPEQIREKILEQLCDVFSARTEETV